MSNRRRLPVVEYSAAVGHCLQKGMPTISLIDGLQ